MPSPHPLSFPTPLAIAFGALTVLAPGGTLAHPTAVDLFDDAVALGLPRSVVLPVSKAQTNNGNADQGQLVVESALDVDVRFHGSAPGEVPSEVSGKMFLGTWRGDRAVMTRSGNHLDISVPRDGGMEVTGFSSDTEDSHGLAIGTDGEGGQHAIAQAAAMPSDPARSITRARPRRSPAAPTLIFWLFLHDDTLGMTRQHIHASYVAWWIADMKRILPTRRLWAIYSQQVEGMTDMPYGHESSINDWTRAVRNYARREKLPHIPGEFEYKFMLVTRDEVAPRTAGLAWLGGNEAMASLTGRYSIIAHEFGHTMSATHDDAEIRWSSGWPCETNLISPASSLRANCYRYSAANERRMRSHAANEWTVPVRPNPPDIPRQLVD